MTSQRDLVSSSHDLDHKSEIKALSDWYTVNVSEFTKLGGSPLFHSYGSLYKLLSSIYPEYLFYTLCITVVLYNWDATKFRPHVQYDHAPRGNWNNMLNQRNKMEEIAHKLSIRNKFIIVCEPKEN